MTLALAIDADSRVAAWHGVDWRRAGRYVRRLQARIVTCAELVEVRLSNRAGGVW